MTPNGGVLTIAQKIVKMKFYLIIVYTLKASQNWKAFSVA